MKINTGKLEDCIGNINNAIEKIQEAIDSLDGIEIPSDYTGISNFNLTTIINNLPDKKTAVEGVRDSIQETIDNSESAEINSENFINSFIGNFVAGINELIGDVNDFAKEAQENVKAGKLDKLNVISGQTGSTSSSAYVNNYSSSNNLGGGISSGGSNNTSINNSGNVHYSTPDSPDDNASQVKFFDPTTGEQLIKSERVNGKDVFIDTKTGEVIADLGAGGPEWSNDVAYLEEMRQKARDTGSETGWLCIVDRDNFKTTVLIFLDGDWRVVKTYDCGTGRKGIEGIAESHTFTGVWKVDHKTQHGGPDDWWTCFIPYYKPDGTDFGQGFHEGYTGVPSYQSYGCTRLTTENAQWIYYNVPINSTVIVF